MAVPQRQVALLRPVPGVLVWFLAAVLLTCNDGAGRPEGCCQARRVTADTDKCRASASRLCGQGHIGADLATKGP